MSAATDGGASSSAPRPLVYFDQHLITRRGHHRSTLEKVRGMLAGDVPLHAYLPTVSGFVTDDARLAVTKAIPRVTRLDPLRRVSTRLARHPVVGILGAIGIALVEVLVAVRYLTRIRLDRAHREPRMVFACDPTLALILYLAIRMRAAGRIALYFAVPPFFHTIGRPVHKRRAFQWMVTVARLSLGRDRLTVLVDDPRIVETIGSRADLLTFPFSGSLAALDDATTVAPTTPTLFIPGGNFWQKNQAAMLAALVVLGEHRLVQAQVRCVVHLRGLDRTALPAWLLREVLVDPGDLTLAEYVRTMKASALVLACYHHRNYSPQGMSSGIVREAAFLGVPVVTSRGSWMAGFLRSHASDPAHLLETGETPACIAQGIERFLAAPERYRTEAMRIRASYRASELAVLAAFSERFAR